MNKPFVIFVTVAMMMIALCTASQVPGLGCFTAQTFADCASLGDRCDWVALGEDRGFCKIADLSRSEIKELHAFEAEQIQAIETQRKVQLLDIFLEDPSLLEIDNQFVTTHYLRELEEIEDEEELLTHYQAILNHKRGHRVPRNATRRAEDGELIQILPIIITPSFQYLEEGESHYEYSVTQVEVQVLDEDQQLPQGFDLVLPNEDQMALTGDFYNCTFNAQPIHLIPIRSTEDALNEDFDPETEIQVYRGLYVPAKLTPSSRNLLKCKDLRFVSVKAPTDNSTIVQYHAQTYSTNLEILHLVSQPTNFKSRLTDNKAWFIIGAVAFAVIVLVIIGVALHLHSRKLSNKNKKAANSSSQQINLPEEEQSLLSIA